MASPANPVFNGMSFIGKPFVKVTQMLRAHDADLTVDGDGHGKRGQSFYTFGVTAVG
jgi:hypothetical protein